MMPLHCLKSLKKHCTIFAETKHWFELKFQACQHFPSPTVRRKEGVNGVNRIATKGEKYDWLPTKREKKFPTTDRKNINPLSTWTDIIYILFYRKRASCIFPTFLGSNLRYHRLSKFNWKDKGEKPSICCFDGRHKSFYKYTTKRGHWNSLHIAYENFYEVTHLFHHFICDKRLH